MKGLLDREFSILGLDGFTLRMLLAAIPAAGLLWAAAVALLALPVG